MPACDQVGQASAWSKLTQILEMIRFSHTIFALPFALLAAVMAWYATGKEDVAGSQSAAAAASDTALPGLVLLSAAIRWQDVVGILVCMVGARSAAMAFNRIVDRRIDAANPRTANRHIPAGVLSVGSVVTFTVGSSLLFVGGTLLFLPNRLPLILSLPVLAFLFGYSYTKRFTSLAHFWLGAALMLAPICTWIALRGAVVMTNPLDLLPAVCLGAAVLMWVGGFDIIYACQDVDFDVAAKLNSVPAKLGVGPSLRLAALCHLLMVGCLAALPFAHGVGGPRLDFGAIYWCGFAAVALLLVYEHALVRPGDLTRINRAFFQVNSIVSMGLFLIGTLDLLI